MSIQILFVFNVILLSTIIIITTATIQDQIDGLSKDQQENILELLLSTRTSRSAVVDQAKNWCCKIEPGVDAITATRQITYSVIIHSRHKCGTYGCGFLNFGRCTKWCSETRVEIQKRPENYVYHIKRGCPNQELTCCAEHVYILGHCFSYMEVHTNQLVIAQLHELNIVIPGPPLG